MKTLLQIGSFLLVGGFSLAQTTRVEFAPKLEAALEEVRQRFRLPGMAVGVVQAGEVVYAHGFGEATRGSGRAITPHSIFHVASVSKLFTATAALQLVEAGKLELDAPLTKYLPYFRLAEEESKAITLRQALTHTSGFPDVRDYGWDRAEKDAGAAERYVRSLASEKLVFAPGQGSRYSNMAFDTLGDVIAKAAGVSFEEYVQSHVLLPLGMGSSSFVYDETDESLRTQGHSAFYSTRIDQAPCPVYPYNRRHAPSSTLNANVADLCRFMLANLARGELDGQRILKAASYDELWSRADATPEIGLGWFLSSTQGTFTAEHSGRDVGFCSYLLLAPDEQLGVVVLVNSDQAPIERIARATLEVARGRTFTVPRAELGFEFAHVFEGSGFEAAVERYFELRETAPEAWRAGFAELDGVCEALLEKQRPADALAVAGLNADEYPSHSLAFARRGQAEAATGDVEAARASFMRALELAPNDALAREGLAALESASGK